MLALPNSRVGCKEIWTHILAYNLIRTVMAQSAVKHERSPRSISFKAAMQVLEAIQPVIQVRARTQQQRQELYDQILDAIGNHRIGNRPDRFKPRLRKRRFKKYDYMMKPRDNTKVDILKEIKKK